MSYYDHCRVSNCKRKKSGLITLLVADRLLASPIVTDPTGTDSELSHKRFGLREVQTAMCHERRSVEQPAITMHHFSACLISCSVVPMPEKDASRTSRCEIFAKLQSTVGSFIGKADHTHNFVEWAKY